MKRTSLGTVAPTMASTAVITCIATLLMALWASGIAQDARSNAAVRFAYLLPGGPNLDIRLEDRVLHPGLIAQTASGYFMVESGEWAFDVTPLPGTSVPGQQTTPDVPEDQIATRIEANLEPGTYTTVLITGTLGEVVPAAEEDADERAASLPPQVAFETSVLTDDLGTLPRAGEVWVRAVNASLDTPPLEVALQRQDPPADQEAPSETILATGLEFGDAGGYEAVAGARYQVAVRTANEVTVELPDLRLDSGLLYTVYVTQGGAVVTMSVDGGVTLATP